MSKAGQSTVTGISLQADITLLYLLEHYHFDNFEEVLVESEDWEDFALKFSDRVDSYEVKWHSRALSFADVKKIIAKEIKKQSSDEKYGFKIVAKSFSSEFLKSANYVKRILPYLGLLDKNAAFDENETIKRFVKKGWSVEEISFLHRTELIALDSEQKVHSAISEYFRYKWHLFLTDEDLKALISISFRDILQKAKTGSSISKQEFEGTIKIFDRNLAEKSESFTPEISVGKRTENIDSFLTTSSEFSKLNHHKYLTPITSLSNRRLIFYITKNLEQNSFKATEISFFLEKVLLKSSYIYTCFRLLEAKWKAGLLDPQYFIKFISDNFDKLPYDHVVHDALEITLGLLQVDSNLSQDVLSFLKKKIFPSLKGTDSPARLDIDYSYKFVHLPPIIDLLAKNLAAKEDFVDLLFQVFDFTGDNYQLVVETPSQVYGLMKEYIKADLDKHLKKVLQKLTRQFKVKYGLRYGGYEFSGGGVGFAGSSFSITDVGLARKLFSPLFHELYIEDKNKFFKFLSKEVFKTKGAEFSANCPIYLKRAAIPLLFKILADNMTSETTKNTAKKYLARTLAIKKGIPNSSEIMFAYLHGSNLREIGHDFVFELILQDQVKYGQDRLPTNVFVIETIFQLIEEGYQPALEHLLSLVKRPDFKRHQEARQLLSLLGNKAVLATKLDVRIKLIREFDIRAFVESDGDDWISSAFLKNLLDDLWENLPEEADALVKDLTKGENPSKEILDLVGNALFDLYGKYPDRIHTIFFQELKDTSLFQSRFKSSDVFRGNFCRLAEALIAISRFDDAKRIVDILIYDSDPNTDEDSQYNNHVKVKQGEAVNSVSGSRVHVAWALQKLVVQNQAELLEYALEKIKILIDLDGSLARRLGYSEQDLYVVGQAIVPLIEMAHPYRRNLMNQHKAGLGDEVKTLAFELLKFLDDQFRQNKSQPNYPSEYLVNVFSYIRDLDTAQASTVLDFFEQAEIERPAFLFIFFGLFRKKEFPSISFDPIPFEERLRRLCSQKSSMRETLSWQLYRTLDSESEKVTDDEVDAIDSIIPLLLKDYQPRVFTYISMTIENALTDDRRYQKYFDLLREAIRIEVKELQAKRDYPKICLRKTAKILADKNISDFLTVLNDILSVSDPQSGEGVYGTNLHSMIEQFKKIEQAPQQEQARYDEAKQKLTEIGAFI